MTVEMRAAINRTSLVVCWLLWQATCRAEILSDLLVSTAVINLDIPAATDGAANLLPNLVTPNTPEYSALPRCQNTSVLLNRGGFPWDWGALSAEQQVAHPINLVMMQLAYAAYQPPDTLKGCLAAMGVDPDSIKAVTVDVPQYQTTRSALVMKAGNERIFVALMGSNFLGGRDISINCDCKQTLVDAGTFGARGREIGLHTGFWTGWQALEQGVTSAVAELLEEVSSGEVYVIGHSLGAAIASLAALRLNVLFPQGRVQGVWLFGCPRVGDFEWARAYDAVLLRNTLRMSNYRDFAARLPGTTQVCSVSGSASSLTLEAFAGKRDVPFQYRHIGRQVLMCPNTQTGLTDWVIYPTGSDNFECGLNRGTPDESDYSGGTHVLGAYFDAWRRGYFACQRSTLSADPRLTAVMCQQCVATESHIVKQMNVPARPGGPVTCSIDQSCSQQEAFSAATAVGSGHSMSWGGSGSFCKAFRCSE